jgi:hypothetical protein
LHDDHYRHALEMAGLSGHIAPQVPLHKRKNFEAVMRFQAHLAADALRDAASLQLASARVFVLQGPATLYRLWDSASPGARAGVWWFDEDTLHRARVEAAVVKAPLLAWLRQALAVCYNFSRLDRALVLNLHAQDALPAVQAAGLAMPHYQFKPYIRPDTGERVIDELPLDYWQQKGKMLFGGAIQTILPWIPKTKMRDAAHL